MNDQQIFALMARTPKIRAVQIADALNQELTDVSAALRALVEEGDVVASKGFSPNGHPAQLYDLSETFKKSAEYKKLFPIGPAAPVAPAPAPAFVPVRVDVVDEQPAAAAVAASPAQEQAIILTPSAAPYGSKVSLAVAYLTKHGRANDAQMRSVMNLSSKTSPSSYLSSAVKNGRVARDGADWVLGAGVESDGAPATRQARLRTAPEATSEADAQLRCALWSDGSLELQRAGATVALLRESEVAFLLGYLAPRVTA